MAKAKLEQTEETTEDGDCGCAWCKAQDKDYSKKLGIISPEELIEAAKRAKIFAYDIETTDLSWRSGKIEGVSIYIPILNDQKEEVWAWFPFTENTFVVSEGNSVRSLRSALDQQTTMTRLKPIWQLPDVHKISANGKFDNAWFQENPGISESIIVLDPQGDSMLADYGADERQRRYGLKQRVKDVFNHRMTTYEEASRRQGTFSFMRSKPLAVYAMEDPFWTYQLHENRLASIRQQDPSGRLEKIYWGIEMKIRKIIIEMETTGCLIDWEHLVELEHRLESQKAELVSKIIKSAGWAPNLRSPSQVSDFLFNSEAEGGLGLPTDGLEQNANGDYSTSEKVIKKFGKKNELVRALLDYRSLEVIDRSFCKKLINIAQTEGRVFTGFHQTGTVTGRLTSSKPINLMNQPRDKGMIRKAFVAKLPGDQESDLVLLDGDYGQIELRLAAHLANEPSLIEVYGSGGTCNCDKYLKGHECKDKNKQKCKWSGLLGPEDEKKCPKCSSEVEWLARCRHVDVHQRTSEDVNVPRNPLAKNLNFGVLYRIGAPKFAIYADLFDEQGHANVGYARELIDKWMTTYWRIPEWHWEEEQRLKQNNWIAYTLTGRRRRLDEEKKFNEYGAITQAINFRVQGSAQDIIKVGMIKVYEERERLIANSPPATANMWRRFKFLVQVHDECLWQCPEGIAEEAKKMIKTNMEGAAKLRVPLVFSIKKGESWEDCH